MSDENQTSAFVCPDCGKAIIVPTTELLAATRVTCENCGHEVALDRRQAPKDGGKPT